jgi:hypothetical protein
MSAFGKVGGPQEGGELRSCSVNGGLTRWRTEQGSAALHNTRRTRRAADASRGRNERHSNTNNLDTLTGSKDTRLPQQIYWGKQERSGRPW